MLINFFSEYHTDAEWSERAKWTYSMNQWIIKKIQHLVQNSLKNESEKKVYEQTVAPQDY